MVYSFCLFWTDRFFKVFDSNFLNHIQLSEIIPFTIHTFGVVELFCIFLCIPTLITVIVAKPLLDEWDKAIAKAEKYIDECPEEDKDQLENEIKEIGQHRKTYTKLKLACYLLSLFGVFVILQISSNNLGKYKNNEGVLVNSYIVKTEKEQIDCVKILNNSPSSLTVIDCELKKIKTINSKQIVSFEKIIKN